MGDSDSNNFRNSRNLLERFLGLFMDIRGGEGVTELLLTLNIFLVFVAYYIIKTVREPLILAGGGAELRAYSAAGQAILLLGAVPLYAMLAGSMPRRRLINIVTVFFTACLVVFYVLAQAKTPYLGVAFFLWVGIFNLMVVAQFWAFANDLHTPEAGKRLFAFVMLGQNIGAWVGGQAAKRLIDPIGVYQLLLVAAVILFMSMIITNIVDFRERDKAAGRVAARAEIAEEPIGKGGAFRLVFASKYLLLIALLVLFLNWVNTTGEYILSRVIVERSEKTAIAEISDAEQLTEAEPSEVAAAGIDAKPSEEELKERQEKHLGKFYGGYYSTVSLVTVLIQLFLVSRILKYFGVRIALLILPIIAFGGYTLIMFYPVLGIIRRIKIAENSIDYSLQNTVRQLLFLPTTREEKYKAKQAIDTFFHRAGDVLQAVLVFVGTSLLAFQTKHFAVAILVLVAIWIILAVMVGRENKRLTANGTE
jgi:AAA family ATP:ADP antiporter